MQLAHCVFHVQVDQKGKNPLIFGADKEDTHC